MKFLFALIAFMAYGACLVYILEHNESFILTKVALAIVGFSCLMAWILV